MISLFGRSKVQLSIFGLEVTQQCNSNCKYCYNVWKCTPSFPTFNAETEKFMEIIRILKEQTKVKLISITGGEPLIRDDISEIVEFMKANKIDCNLLTNGSLINEKNAEELANLGISIFEIPLLAPEAKTHDELMGANIFQNAVSGIAELTSNDANVVTAFVATKKNIDRVGETMDLAFSLGAKGIMFNRFNPGGEGLNHIDELMPTIGQFKNALEVVDDKAKELGLFVSSQIPTPPCIHDMTKYKHITTGYCPGGGTGSYFTIDGGGNVRICNHSPVILGNLFESQFTDLVKSPSLKEFQEIVPSICVSCEHLSTCNAGCKAAGLVCFGGFDKFEPFLEFNRK